MLYFEQVLDLILNIDEGIEKEEKEQKDLSNNIQNNNEKKEELSKENVLLEKEQKSILEEIEVLNELKNINNELQKLQDQISKEKSNEQILKENNVQLIAPGHNISKEIISMFEVNYVLKHELKDGNKKTVVVEQEFRTEDSLKNMNFDIIDGNQQKLF